MTADRAAADTVRDELESVIEDAIFQTETALEAAIKATDRLLPKADVSLLTFDQRCGAFFDAVLRVARGQP